MKRDKIIALIIVCTVVLGGVTMAVQARIKAQKINNSKNQLPPIPTEVAAKDVTVKGKIVCLPHKKSDGPQTLECAFGLKTEDGKYYGLKNPDPTAAINYPQNKTVKVTGKLNEDRESKYDIIGTIEVEKIEE